MVVWRHREIRRDQEIPDPAFAFGLPGVGWKNSKPQEECPVPKDWLARSFEL
jgi:hypothetical protein